MAVAKTKSNTRKQIVSYEIPNSFNPFEMGERIIRVEEELKYQRELMLEGFKAMDKRFADMQKSFDRRFEDMQKNFDKRFEAVNKRFEVVDKRFEDMQKNFDRRFEAVDKRFNLVLWTIAGGFAGTWAILAILLSQL